MTNVRLFLFLFISFNNNTDLHQLFHQVIHFTFNILCSISGPSELVTRTSSWRYVNCKQVECLERKFYLPCKILHCRPGMGHLLHVFIAKCQGMEKDKWLFLAEKWRKYPLYFIFWRCEGIGSDGTYQFFSITSEFLFSASSKMALCIVSRHKSME